MALRVLNYITNFYMDFLVNNSGVSKLPAVFPIVLYNGSAPWTAPMNLSALIEQTPPLGRFTLDFEYFLIAENRYSQEALLNIRNIVSTLFLAESHYDLDLLEVELLNLFSSEDDKEAVSLFLNWFRQLAFHGRLEASCNMVLSRDSSRHTPYAVTPFAPAERYVYRTAIGLIPALQRSAMCRT